MNRISRNVAYMVSVCVISAGIATAGEPETSGKRATVTVANAPPTELPDGTLVPSEWRYLQAFQIHLEDKYPGRRIEIDCDTNVPEFSEEGNPLDGISCAELFAATSASDGTTPEARKVYGVKQLIYTVADSQWNGQLSSGFQYAERQTNAEAKRKTPAGKDPVVVDAAVVNVTLTAQTACTQFASPCMYRPMCSGTGKCSKVSTGCVLCTYP